MAVTVDMPKLSDTMEEGVIAKWKVKEGDKVKSGDIIAEVETDKATMDVEVFDSGTILKILAAEGEAIPLGKKIAVIGEEGEDISGLLSEEEESGEKGGKEPEEPKEEKAEPEEEKKQEEPAEKNGKKKGKSFDPLFGGLNKQKEEGSEEPEAKGERVKASPLARKMAEDQGIDLSGVKGSGPGGRIVKRDIEGYEEKPSVRAEETLREEEIRISQMRKTIARRLAESKFTSPHFYETIDINMKNAITARERLNEVSDVKISYNDLVMKACAVALHRHPEVNSSWKEDVILRHGSVHIAMAVAVEEGLITPVVRNVDRKGLREIAVETKQLAQKARDRKLQPEEWEGSTFSVSNLGMFGIEEFTAIINPPNACILAIGAIRDVPVVESGAVVPGKKMKVTLSSDHRIVDGALAAEFLTTLRKLLEDPVSMML